MWIFIIIGIIVFVVIMFRTDKKEADIKLEKQGGLRQKYHKLISHLLADNNAKMCNVTKDSLQIIWKDNSSQAEFFLMHNFDKILVKWKFKNTFSDSLYAKWEFKETINQDEMAKKIMQDIQFKMDNEFDYDKLTKTLALNIFGEKDTSNDYMEYEYEQNDTAIKSDEELSLLEGLKSGNAENYYNLASFYSSKDPFDERAVIYYKKSIDLGYTPAMSDLGIWNLNRLRYDEAFKWLSKAANLDYAFAQYNLGEMYLRDFGNGRDLNKAKYWIRKAFNQKDIQAIIFCEENPWILK